MSDDRLEGELRSWLGDEAARLRLPASLREDVAAIAAMGGTGPVPDRDIARLEPTLVGLPWPGTRSVTMKGAGKMMVAAGLVVFAIVGTALLRNPGDDSAPVGATGPSGAAATPWPSDPSCVGVQSIAADSCRIFGWSPRVLSPGRHSVVVDGVAFSFEVPGEGWEQFGDVSLNSSFTRGQAAEAIIYWTKFPGGAIVDACWASLDMGVGPSVADAADDVAHASGIEVVTPPSDVEIGGRAAKYVEVTVRDDSVSCTPGYFHLWSAPFAGALWVRPGVGATIRVWIIDVNGTRLFIAGETVAGVDQVADDDIRAIVGSIRFE